jgi:LmbE family N-acetylglucosaminyl deacetylase
MTRRLMCVLAHPDDESLGTGGTLARYAAEGVETVLVTATRGQRGWFGDPAENPGLDALGAIRERELREAASALGACEVHLLDYVDGDLDQADPAEAVGRIAAHIRRARPQVVVTFGPDGVYGHPDHIAICQLATAAVIEAAAPANGDAGHRVSKLYYMAETRERVRQYEGVFGELVMTVDGGERRTPGWPDWMITTRLDTSAHWETVWQAIQCHRTQLPGYEALQNLPAERHAAMWGTQSYYRAFSLVNGGRETETDLFEGIGG